MGPYTFQFKNPSVTIAGIVGYPVENKKIQSHEATVTGGGVNWKHAHIWNQQKKANGHTTLPSAQKNIHETRA
jgi:hypothetical protein